MRASKDTRFSVWKPPSAPYSTAELKMKDVDKDMQKQKERERISKERQEEEEQKEGWDSVDLGSADGEEKSEAAHQKAKDRTKSKDKEKDTQKPAAAPKKIAAPTTSAGGASSNSAASKARFLLGASKQSISTKAIPPRMLVPCIICVLIFLCSQRWISAAWAQNRQSPLAQSRLRHARAHRYRHHRLCLNRQLLDPLALLQPLHRKQHAQLALRLRLLRMQLRQHNERNRLLLHRSLRLSLRRSGIRVRSPPKMHPQQHHQAPHPNNRLRC